MENMIKSLNLYEYIKNGLLLKNIEQYKLFDIVIFEKFSNKEIELKTNIKTLNELYYDFSVSGTLDALIAKHKHPLIILDEINIDYLLPLVRQDKDITIINLGAGISGLTNKQRPDLDDVSVMSALNIDIYEPFDFQSLIAILQTPSKKYIRIANKEFATSILQENNIDLKQDIVSLEEYGLSGSNGTFICPGNLVVEGVNALNTAQSKGVFYDMFVMTKYDIQITNELKKSIMKTENIIMVLDQKPDSIYEKILQSKLWEKGLFDTRIKFIYPDIDKIKTTMIDYLYSQAGLDGEGIWKAI